MNTFKNFIYNISDILVALLIIAAAVLIIGWACKHDYGLSR